MALNSIEKEWNGFAKMIFAKTKPSEIQIEEMRKAFFAGAWSLFTAMEEIGEPHISEEEGFAYLEARRTECIAFRNDLMRRYSETN